MPGRQHCSRLQYYLLMFMDLIRCLQVPFVPLHWMTSNTCCIFIFFLLFFVFCFSELRVNIIVFNYTFSNDCLFSRLLGMEAFDEEIAIVEVLYDQLPVYMMLEWGCLFSSQLHSSYGFHLHQHSRSNLFSINIQSRAMINANVAIVQAALIILRLINQGTLRLFHELKLGELGEINIFCQPQPRTTSTIAAASFLSPLLAHFSHPLNFVSSEQKLLKS